MTVENASGRGFAHLEKTAAVPLVTIYGRLTAQGQRQARNYRTAIVTMLLVRAPEVTLSGAESSPDKPDGTTQLI